MYVCQVVFKVAVPEDEDKRMHRATGVKGGSDNVVKGMASHGRSSLPVASIAHGAVGTESDEESR